MLMNVLCVEKVDRRVSGFWNSWNLDDALGCDGCMSQWVLSSRYTYVCMDLCTVCTEYVMYGVLYVLRSGVGNVLGAVTARAV